MEPERIELSSREDEPAGSTCLSVFNCRRVQGSRKPDHPLSRCFSTVPRGTEQPSLAFRRQNPAPAKQRNRLTMAFPHLIREQAYLTLGQIKQPWRRYSRHLCFETLFQSAGFTRLHAGLQPHTTCQNRSAPVSEKRFRRIHNAVRAKKFPKLTSSPARTA